MLLRLLVFTLFLFVMNIFPQTMPPIEAGVSQTLAKWRAANYSDVRYKLNLTLEKMSPTLKGTIEIRVKNNADQIVLDWRKIRGKEDLSKISSVSINEKTANYEEINEHLVFKNDVVKGENVIKLDFTSPIATSGAAITRYVDKEDGAEYVYSLFVPSDASMAFPVFDQPDLKARFQLNVFAPIDWKVVSNVQTPLFTITNSSRDTSGLRIFKETKPISTYVFAFAAGEFAEFEDKDFTAEAQSSRGETQRNSRRNSAESPRLGGKNSLESKIYVRKSQAGKFKQHAAEVFRLNREGVKFLENYFDYKFPFPKYDLVLIPEFPFGGMEHAGATFLREDRVIFPTEPTKNDYITRANVIFHEAAHQWFGDTVTMKWFDDLWLKEGFAEFMAYKCLEKVMPEYNAWKIFYERNKQLAYLTDATKGTTPIYQEIPNLSAAKSAYGNIVYRKAPSFLKQAEFYLGADKFQTAVRAFLKKHEFANAEWTDLVKEFETASKQDLKDWANVWVTKHGTPQVNAASHIITQDEANVVYVKQKGLIEDVLRPMNFNVLIIKKNNQRESRTITFKGIKNPPTSEKNEEFYTIKNETPPVLLRDVALVFPNYQDYGYGIFLLDERSRAYVLENIQTEKDDFLRAMMWGSLWDSVREAELNPKDYVALVIKNINVETDESTIQTLLNRVLTAMNYYIPEGGNPRVSKGVSSDAKSENNRSKNTLTNVRVSAPKRNELAAQLENILIDKMQNAPTLGQRITFYRAFLNVASTDKAQGILKDVLSGKLAIKDLKLKTKDRFDIVTKLLVLGDKEAPMLLAELEKKETTDEAKRYAYAAKAGIAAGENKAKFWNDFTVNKEISESWIESAFVPFNSPRHADLTLPYLEKALAELPNLKRNRKIFFVNGWLSAFIGGQKSERALEIVNKFIADNPNLDRDLRLKILENSDGLERAVKIRRKFSDAK
jgi:aminopeptidase N